MWIDLRPRSLTRDDEHKTMPPSTPSLPPTNRWHFIDLSATSQVRPLGFDPAVAFQVSRPVAVCPKNLKTAFRLRRSGTTETSLVSILVTDLVTGHTCKRPSPMGKGL
jgi:hypothetical protein